MSERLEGAEVSTHRMIVATFLIFAIGVSSPRAESIDTLIVANKVGGTAWLVDPVTGEARAKLPVGDGPHEAAASPDGRTAVVCNYGGSTLSVVDVEQGKVDRTIDLSPHRSPHGIRYLDSDHVLVTSETSRKLLEVNVASGEVVAAYEPGGGIHMVDLSPDAKTAYATAIGAGLLSRIDLASADAKPDTLALGSGTEALAVRPDGKESEQQELVQKVVADGARPIGVLVAPDGDEAYVAARGQEHVAVVDTSTWKVIRRLPAGEGPDGMAWSTIANK